MLTGGGKQGGFDTFAKNIHFASCAGTVCTMRNTAFLRQSIAKNMNELIKLKEMKKLLLLLGAMSSLTLAANVAEFDFSKISSPTTSTSSSFTITQGSFTLTVDRPATECLVGDSLRIPVNATFSFKQNDGHRINMLGLDGRIKNAVLDAHVLVQQMGKFKDEDHAKVNINQWGNDYTEFGKSGNDYKTSDGFKYVVNLNSANPSYTFTDKNYAINDKYISFKKLTVRDDDISSEIVYQPGIYHGFNWTISNDMVAVAYKNGMLYCRSLEDSKLPKQTNTDKPLGLNQDPANYTNYDWIAINFTDELKTQWENIWNESSTDRIIKGGTIQGLYCDFSSNGVSKETFLNPTINASRLPELKTEKEATKRNSYYIANMNEQKDVFFMSPKLNEVCNVLQAVRGYNNNLMNPQYSREKHEIYGNVMIKNATSTPLPGVSFPDYKTFDLKDAIILMSDHRLTYYTWRIPDPKKPHSAYPENFSGEIMPPTFLQEKRLPYYYNIYANYALEINAVLVEHNINIHTGLNGVETDKKIVAVKYSNLMGMQSNEPFDGTNIVTTCYNNGTHTTKKCVK